MPADHAHLAPQKLYTVREDHVLPARTRAEKARRNEESGDANVAKDARAGGPQLAERIFTASRTYSQGIG